ncbi:type-F conjugative transfer system mating-pair stabilization protein TraN (plasmid) [Pectobacteriaceae bacterium CE70]|nr:type-F conjugative transfer system mating-pair stabilization protein TraN [Prodigiosinella sp. LS101]WJV60601.1 type-F conjugative transfer system mating-pair stabilization protein TraN [Pectobacteriaceae bacterium C111]WJV64864.1 type-F conjugative transfer system mating-pair stabilization protein TraN [Pectobacteriaceae bacterium C52]WJV69205.1 type-F conjugative transfer system mating-pair stabilization protein TraN [Pectobacteriaceae bacterium CE70]WJY13132.1 type-F conjugative transfer 
MKARVGLLVACFIVSFGARSDNMDDAFNQGTTEAKQSSGLGINALNDTGVISGTISGYTANPSQSSYYGGVSGGDNGLADAGTSAVQSNDTAQTVISSSTSNPAVTIDSTATFITNGKNAELNSSTIANGTNSQCTSSVVSKTAFENYSCDKDVGTVETCARTGAASGHWSVESTEQTITLTNSDFFFRYDGNLGIYYGFTPTVNGVVVSGNMHITRTGKSGAGSFSTTFLNSSFTYADGGFNTALGNWVNEFDHSLDRSVGYTLVSGQALTFHFSSTNGCSGFWCNFAKQDADTRANAFKSGIYQIRVTLVVKTEKRVWIPQVTFTESCNFDKSTGNLINTVCSSEGGTKVIDGQTVSSDCWQYTDEYYVPSDSLGTCGTYISNANCTATGTSCSESTSGYCTHQTITYQCQTTYTSEGLLCGGSYFCMTGDCNDTTGAGDSGFDTAVAKLAGLASAGEDVKNDQINVKAFTGQAMSCRKAMAGFSNCCVDSGWGNSVGLANCNSEEMAIGKAKAKKVVVSVGQACAHAVLGVCIQKKQVYCVFGGKLARIIQEQGRRDQLGVSFGSGDSPNCRGITISELQNINFDLINFSDFYSDLMANQKIPDSSAMVKQAKDRIAAQVNAQTGGK